MDKMKKTYILTFSALLVILLTGSYLLKNNSEQKVYESFSLYDSFNKLYSIEDLQIKKRLSSYLCQLNVRFPMRIIVGWKH